MTLLEAIAEIKTKHKPYIGVMHQATYCNTMKDIRLGTAKESTIERFVLKFGYEKVEGNCFLQFPKVLLTRS